MSKENEGVGFYTPMDIAPGEYERPNVAGSQPLDQGLQHGLHVLVCKILSLDDEDHEDGELAAPLEEAFMQLYLPHMEAVVSHIIGEDEPPYSNQSTRINNIKGQQRRRAAKYLTPNTKKGE